jgi:hypothetical protein
MTYTITNSLINMGSAKQMYDTYTASDFKLISWAIQSVRKRSMIIKKAMSNIHTPTTEKRNIN